MEGSKAGRINVLEHTVHPAAVPSHRYETVLGMRTCLCACVLWQVGLHTGLGLHITSCQVLFVPTAHFILFFIKCTRSTHIFLEALVCSSRNSIRSNHVLVENGNFVVVIQSLCRAQLEIFPQKDVKCCSAHVVLTGLIV